MIRGYSWVMQVQLTDIHDPQKDKAQIKKLDLKNKNKNLEGGLAKIFGKVSERGKL